MPVFPSRPPPKGEQPDEPHSFPGDKEKTGGKQDRSFFTYFKPYFSKFLGDLIAEEARAEAQADPYSSASHLREISMQKQRQEVLEGATAISKSLEEIKKRLTAEFGNSASSFIVKSIDPMIDHAKRLIHELGESDKKTISDFQDLLEHAVDSVELYTQFSDETKLKKKIVHEAHQFVKKAINRDIAEIINYKLQALSQLELSTVEHRGRQEQLERFLFPIMTELETMLQAKIQTDDLHDFFVWKTAIDDQRAALVELGLLTIDALISPSSLPPVVSPEENEFEEGALRTEVEEYSLILSFLSLLEDRANALEQIPFQDPGSYGLIEELLTDLKEDAKRFDSFASRKSVKLEKDFQSLQERIQRADDRLQSHKNDLQ